MYDGDSPSSPQILKWSGENTVKVVNSTGQNLFLKFTTDLSLTYTGFKINFEGKKIYKLLDSEARVSNVSVGEGEGERGEE